MSLLNTLLTLSPIFIIIGIIVAILALKIVTGVMKIAFYALLLIIILSGVFGYFIIKDVHAFNKGITTEENLYLLVDDDVIITGFLVSGLNFTKADSLSVSEISKFNNYMKTSEKEKILEGKYKLFMINMSAFPNATLSTKDVLKQFTDAEIELPKEIEILEESKSSAFLLLVLGSMKKDPLFLIKQFKSGNLVVYPETIMFKTLKYIAR